MADFHEHQCPCCETPQDCRDPINCFEDDDPWGGGYCLECIQAGCESKHGSCRNDDDDLGDLDDYDEARLSSEQEKRS